MDTLLLITAVFPALFLIRYIYKKDNIEKEPIRLIVKLLIWGGLSVVSAFIFEVIFDEVALAISDGDITLYAFLENFIVVACVEEAGKYIVLKKITWKNPEFNYRFDAMVYAVSVSLGFALVENIMYVFDYGLSVAILRAFTAVPAHTIFGVFMGYHYGNAKDFDFQDRKIKCRFERKLALLIPVILHGTYDYLADSEDDYLYLLFFVLLVILYIFAYIRLKRYSKNDYSISTDF